MMYVDESEVKRRGELQMSGMNMAAVRVWCGNRVNRMLLQHYCSALEEAMEDTDPEVCRQVWGRMLAEPLMKALFMALGPGSREMRRRGMQGDEYAIRVFHYLMHRFCHDRYFIPAPGDEWLLREKW
ncbi:TPA: hypothetical protein N3A45_004578 [Salmonella enterica subsp. salamae serovar [1],40:z35:e,n,x,z15]|nr:hypothetical protein [Salmonella enterica]HCM2001364.1 hypothetical protein [Salmonella enterica subsp. salamae serovar [1],40:z35:e,n,x,z15]